MSTVATRSPLQQMTETTPTSLWNDSSAKDELKYSMEHGGVGATCNPVIVVDVLKKEMDIWAPRIRQLIKEHPSATESEIGWMLVEDISKAGAAMLNPVFEKHRGRNGRLSMQTDPRFYRNANAMVRQAEHFNSLAPNLIIKIP